MKRFFLDDDRIIVIILIAITTLTYLLFSTWNKNCYSFDNGNFALAVKSYSISDARPHIPGYFLHIKLITLFSLLTRNIFAAMTLLSALYSGMTAGILFLLLHKWFSSKDAIFVTLFTITNPLVWFYGCSSEIYSFDFLLGILLVYIGLSRRMIYILPIAMALATGIRPSSPVLLLPLYVYLWIQHHLSYSINWKKFLFGHIVGVLTLLCWFIPMINTTGGLKNYLALYESRPPMTTVTLLKNLYKFISFFVYVAVPVFIVITSLFFISRKERKGAGYSRNINISPKSLYLLLFFWIVPPLLFFAFYHYAKGYILLITGGITCLTLLITYKYSLRRYVFSIVILLQLLFFIFTPYSLPDTEIFISPQKRSLGLMPVWLERMGSIFLMSQSHIRKLDELDDIIGPVVDNMENCSEESWYNEKYLLIDPSCPIFVRALQAKHPHIHFAVLDLIHEDSYSTYIGLDKTKRKGVKELLSSSLIFGRADFINRYIFESSIEKEIFDEWALYKYTEDALLKDDIPHVTFYVR